MIAFRSASFFVLPLACAITLLQGYRPAIGADDTVNKPASAEKSHRVHFDLESLSNVPKVFPADDLQVDGVKSFFYQGLDYEGHETRVFAYYGTPTRRADAKDEKFPAMVLVHGGGGTAFDRWVKLWNSRGYAAIAMDLCGCVPVGTYGNWKRHELGGPAGWDASFGQLENPIHEQWTYQAVAAVALGHSLVRSYAEIDRDRIGVTGISWGGYLTSIVAGVDSRFRFAAPVYGCGYLGDNSAWLPALEKLGAEQAGVWLRQWDPAQYLPDSKMPVLWVNGTNDFAYPMDSWQKSYRLGKGPRTLCLRVRMPHGHGPAGENPEEIRVFTDSILRQGKPMAQFTEQGQSDEEVWAKYRSEVPMTKAELNFTLDAGRWQDRKWEQTPAEIDSSSHRVHAQIPANAKVCYLNIFDARDCVVSSEHFER